MITDVKQAVKLALDFFTNLYRGKLSSSDVLLEEVELTEDGKYWLITLSYPIANPLSITKQLKKREYKVFKINVESGKVQSMKIREVA